MRKAKNPDDFMGTNGMLNILSNTDITFSKTYNAIADLGQQWGIVFGGYNPPTNGNAWDKILYFFEFFGNIILGFYELAKFPVMVVVDLCTNAAQTIDVFVQFVGYIPE